MGVRVDERGEDQAIGQVQDVRGRGVMPKLVDRPHGEDLGAGAGRAVGRGGEVVEAEEDRAGGVDGVRVGDGERLDAEDGVGEVLEGEEVGIHARRTGIPMILGTFARSRLPCRAPGTDPGARVGARIRRRTELGAQTMQRRIKTLRRMNLLAIPAAALLTGCVGQGDWDRLYETNRSLTDQNQQLRQEADSAKAAAELLRQQNARTEAALADLRSQYDRALAQLGLSEQALRDLEGRFGNIALSPLDAETDAALKALAAQYPDLITYDESRGMLRFASDLTFDSGSDVVKPEARQSLAALANILKNPVAQQYDVIVMGHTDSQRISARTAQRFPTNVHLSAGRAISVRSELVGQGVSPEKMQVAGWGEFRPSVPNSASGNTPQNRRVEIYLTKPKGGSMTGAAAPAASGAPVSGFREVTPGIESSPTRQPEITK